jgi:aspartate kinase
MSFMIDEEDVEEAIRSLHRVFFTEVDETVFDTGARTPELHARPAATNSL